MKVRTGFVSNSSSSSFCIIGVNDEWPVKLAEKEGLRKVGEDYEWEIGHGSMSGKVLQYYGGDKPYYAGLDAEELLQKMTIPKACKHVQGIIKQRLGIEIPIGEIKFYFGEAGDG